MVLPIELIDLIFSFLSNDMSALKACSSVRQFSKHAKRLLYKDIVIRTSGTLAYELHKQLSDNPSLLDYPRTLDIQSSVSNSPPVYSIIQMIPRMANLKTLKLDRSPYQQEDFVSMFGRCLQQSTINELCLYQVHDFPLSFLDNCKTIRKLTMDNCSAKKDVISGSESDSPLETLQIGRFDTPDIRFWASRRLTSLTELQLCGPRNDCDWTAIPELLTACSSSLTTLHLGTKEHFLSCYAYNEDNYDGHWTNDDLEFPFTLSALTRLKKLYISASIYSLSNGSNKFTIRWALPAIIRLVKTLPSVEELNFDFHCVVSESDISHLAGLDWSLFDTLQSDFPDIRPNICISCEALFQSIPTGRLLNVLAENEDLVDMLDEGVVYVVAKQIPDTISLLTGGPGSY